VKERNIRYDHRRGRDDDHQRREMTIEGEREREREREMMIKGERL
jgi:hypothetical protein